MDYIEFEDAGIRFEIQGPLEDGRWLVDAHDGDVRIGGRHAHDRDRVGSVVDGFLLELPEERRATGYAGLTIVVHDHETRSENSRSYPTRGSLLAWFDDGSTPTLDEVLDLAECNGDTVLEIRDRNGAVLLDRREEGLAKVANDMVGP